MASVLQTADNVNLGFGKVKAWAEQNLDRYRPTPLASPCKNDNSPVKGIQKTIQNLLNDIRDRDTIAELFGGGDPNREAFIQRTLDIASGDIAGYVKTIFESIRAHTFNFFALETKKELPFLFPSEIPEYQKKVDQGNNLISCLFNKLVRQLPGIIGNILLGLLDKVVDVAFCLVTNFINDLLVNSGILDQITNVVRTALGLFSQGVATLTNALTFVNGILDFFRCDDDADCPQQLEVNLAGQTIGPDPEIQGTTIGADIGLLPTDQRPSTGTVLDNTNTVA
jgi:hypothetical protein